MTNSYESQPTKIILIGTGEMGYAEVEIDRSVHLVGDNNAGKTTLINALQFLYINDHRKLDFGDYDNRESMRFYFKNGERAYILFEVLTKTGFWVFGLHGTGLQNGHRPERFLYKGRYERRTFIPDGNRVRPIEKVAPLLAEKDFRRLNNAEHKGVLIGLGRTGLPSLLLVPVAEAGDYEQFVTVFKHLIHLHRVDVVELKSLMEAINHRNMNSTRGLDLNTAYQQQYDAVCREDRRIEETGKLGPLVNEVRELGKDRTVYLDRLPSLYATIEQELTLEEDRLKSEISHLTDQNHSMGMEVEKDGGAISELEHEKTARATEKGGIKKDIELIENNAERFKDYLVEMEKQALLNQKNVLRKLQRRQIHAEKKPHEIKKELASNQKQQQETKNISRSTLNELRKMLPDASVVQLSRLINHRVLLSPFNDSEGVFAKDEAEFERKMQALCKGFANDQYDDKFIIIGLPVDEGIDLSKYSSAESIENHLAQLKEEEISLAQALKDSQESVKIQQEIARTENDINEGERTLNDYRAYITSADQLPGLKKSFDNLSGIIDEIQGKMNKMRHLNDQRKDTVHKNNGKIASNKSSINRNLETFSKLEIPEKTREAGLVDFGTTVLSELIALYEKERSDYNKINVKFEAARNHLAENDLLREVPFDLVVERACEYIDALDDVIRHRNNAWDSLFKEIQRACRDLLDNLKTIQSFSSRLTTELNRKAISNLQRIETHIIESKQLVDKLNIFVSEVDLFAPEANKQETAKDFLRDFLRQRSTINLADLYSLSFEVTKASGTKVTYSDLNIESTGTSLTVKVLVNVYMLNTLLHKRKMTTAIPFYVDEFGKLGLKNQESIVDMASRLSCIPIVASPGSSNVTDRVYTLASGHGQAWVDERNKYERIHAAVQ